MSKPVAKDQTHTAQQQKALGAFYTPELMAGLLVDWALREETDTMIDPSFGGLVFLHQAARRLQELGASRKQALGRIWGVDLDDIALARARADGLALPKGHLIHSDFFAVAPDRLPPLTANIGNPPYVRYQQWDDEQGLVAATGLATGVKLSKMASLWAPFLLHGSRFLADGGRLAQVLPAELLFAQYSEPVADYLRTHFSSVKIATFEQLVFPGALEEVVLLFADGFRQGRAKNIEVLDCRSLADLSVDDIHSKRGRPYRNNYRAVFLSPAQHRLIDTIKSEHNFLPLSDIATVNLGAVTGANKFFLISETEAASWRLPDAALAPIVSKASDTPGARLTADDLDRIADRGRANKLLKLDAADDKVVAACADYLHHGQDQGVHLGFKCRNREPWYAVPMPTIGIPDFTLTYVNDLHPRIALNAAKAWTTNTIHGGIVHGRLNKEKLVAGFYNSLTLLSCELAGRSYGGGALKLEPTEAAAVLVPHPRSIGQISLARVDRLVRNGDLRALLDYVDTIVFADLDPGQLRKIRVAYEKLLRRRLTRSNHARAAERLAGLGLLKKN